MSFKIVSQDITQMQVDAIVNAANTDLAMGGGVCGAIFRAAGPLLLEKACQEISPIETGQAVITPGFGLKAKYIIHTAGPIYDPSKVEQARNDLESSYRNSLELAKDKGVLSIAFPLISAGIYGYPKSQAFEIAKKSIESFLESNDMDVFLTIVDRDLLDAINISK